MGVKGWLWDLTLLMEQHTLMAREEMLVHLLNSMLSTSEYILGTLSSHLMVLVEDIMIFFCCQIALNAIPINIAAECNLFNYS